MMSWGVSQEDDVGIPLQAQPTGGWGTGHMTC